MVKKLLVVLALGSFLLSSSALACPKKAQMKSCTCKKSVHTKHSVVRNVVKAVSQTGLTAAQTKKIADGIGEYRATMIKISEMRIFPIDSFIGDSFHEERFINEMSKKYQSKIAAKAALFKFVFAILDDEQRKVFKRAYAAPLIEKMIHMDITGSKGQEMSQAMGRGMGRGQGMGRGNRMSPKGCTSCRD